MTSPLLQDGFLENALALPCLYHAINLVCRGFLPGDCVYSPLHNFSTDGMEMFLIHKFDNRRMSCNALALSLFTSLGTLGFMG